MMESTGKPFWQSKTLWVNLLMGVGSYLLPKEVGEQLTPEVLASVFVVVNLLLRFLTKEGLQIS